MPINSRNERSGFTLIELLISTLIFSFMIVSLATIYITTHRHMVQNYRQNVIKGSGAVAMKSLLRNLSVATRIRVPALGVGGNTLEIVQNADHYSGCYPMRAGDPVTWHVYCRAANGWLYHHTGNFPGGAGCPGAANPVAPVPVCGAAAMGQTVTLLTQHASPPVGGPGFIFSRIGVPGNVVQINLRIYWNANAAGRDIDYTYPTQAVVNFGP